MTIREAWRACENRSIGPATYRIGFNGGDETELDVSGVGDLEELWQSLRFELKCPSGEVDYVERV